VATESHSGQLAGDISSVRISWGSENTSRKIACSL
jgi:hypothetical protein